MKRRESYFGMGLVILHRSQMTRTTLEIALPSPDFRTTLMGGRLTYDVTFDVQHARTQGGSSQESGFDLGTLRPRSQDLTTRSQRSSDSF
ncbi:hypothetical protein AVEN_259936-1 [Araneus ventricosus]|uniref:Uncharacterized protein n=1 Tax=Araneus ventricosus TaxID=182803 RepID=A0A4Y2GMJ8_ARAVE|nr:hypothetical protein AVEN_259936-1 [Araneus ventricosus]